MDKRKTAEHKKSMRAALQQQAGEDQALQLAVHVPSVQGLPVATPATYRKSMGPVVDAIPIDEEQDFDRIHNPKGFESKGGS